MRTGFLDASVNGLVSVGVLKLATDPHGLTQTGLAALGGPLPVQAVT